MIVYVTLFFGVVASICGRKAGFRVQSLGLGRIVGRLHRVLERLYSSVADCVQVAPPWPVGIRQRLASFCFSAGKTYIVDSIVYLWHTFLKPEEMLGLRCAVSGCLWMKFRCHKALKQFCRRECTVPGILEGVDGESFYRLFLGTYRRDRPAAIQKAELLPTVRGQIHSTR